MSVCSAVGDGEREFVASSVSFLPYVQPVRNGIGRAPGAPAALAPGRRRGLRRWSGGYRCYSGSGRSKQISELHTTKFLSHKERNSMGFGVSFFLLAVGAILTFAVHVSNSHGFDINTIGVILMVVGALGLVVSMIFWCSWNHRGTDTVVREREVL